MIKAPALHSQGAAGRRAVAEKVASAPRIDQTDRAIADHELEKISKQHHPTPLLLRALLLLPQCLSFTKFFLRNRMIVNRFVDG
jgi:hypothetical protein